MEKKIETALSLRKNGEFIKSNQLLLELVQENKDSPYLNYQVAWSFDIMEKENEAVFYYEAAIKNGLSGTDLEGAYLGLGSTYRTLGQYVLAEKTLTKGMEEFPENNALKVFYSMVLYNLERYSEGMAILLSLLSSTSGDKDIVEYKKAIMFYADKLDKIW
ncbi:tetratricopeptide repeat protein [Enterococcus sp. 5H]|uniref:tetratricopeptide repeat protein n=1 Tax=Enterococcus sp. 5H TaxID=1229490 RepID=UPI002302D5DD|nr:tetratricopeptide repeat protein [Enterococcus sp. 5H]MDA9471621.1 hypothetical protein [Enterococcus sp. 5H]